MSENKNSKIGGADLNQMVENLAAGTYELKEPIFSNNKEFKELRFDFRKLRGKDLISAQTTGNGFNVFSLSPDQALYLFAIAAAKCTEGVDAIDVRENAGIDDAIKMQQRACNFFRFSSLAGDRRFSGTSSD